MNKKNIILALVIIVLIGAVGYFAYIRQSSRNDSFAGTWNVVSVELGDVRLVNGGNASIEFLNNRTYKALGGCNDMGVSSYEVSSNTKIALQAFGTKKKCSDNIVEFHDLAKVHSFELNDGTLFLHYREDSGQEGVFKLQRI